MLNDTLSFLTDSLNTITDSIANGGALEEARQSITNAIETFGMDRTTVTDLRDQQDSLTSVMNGIVSVINSGLIKVDRIDIIETGGFLAYEDSATSFSVPLSLNEAFFNYQVTIGSVIDTFEVDYELFQEVDESRNVLTRARNIEIVSHTFDTLEACIENCFDGQATYTFRF